MKDQSREQNQTRPTSAKKAVAPSIVMLFFFLSISVLLLIVGCQNRSPITTGPVNVSISESSKKDAIETLDKYLETVNNNDFPGQKKLTSGKALRFSLFKELEAELATNTDKKTTVATPDFKILKADEKRVKFKGSVTIASIQTKGISYSVSTNKFADPIMTKTNAGTWKLNDFVRDGKAISDTIFTIDKDVKTRNFNVKVLDILLLPKRSLVEVMVQNISSDDIVTVIERSSLSVRATDDVVLKKLPVQTNDPILKKYHYIEENEILTGFLGFNKASSDARNFLFELILTSDDAVEFQISLPDP